MVIQRTIHQMYHGTTRGRNLGGTGHIVPIHDKITCQEVITRGIVRYDMSRLIIYGTRERQFPIPSLGMDRRETHPVCPACCGFIFSVHIHLARNGNNAVYEMVVQEFQ